MTTGRQADMETLTGIVTPVQWNDDGRVAAVALYATDDEAYWIENGDTFLGLVQQAIEATGTVNRNAPSPKSIFIKHFDILEHF